MIEIDSSSQVPVILVAYALALHVNKFTSLSSLYSVQQAWCHNVTQLHIVAPAATSPTSRIAPSSSFFGLMSLMLTSGS